MKGVDCVGSAHGAGKGNVMKNTSPWTAWLAVAAVVFVVGPGGAASAGGETAAQADEQVGVEGTFVRVATNKEGWVVLGYRIANESVGKDWMLLEVGLTVTKGTKAQTIARGDISLVTPKNEVISLPTQEEYEKARGFLVPLVKRAAMTGESINYFPPSADTPCQIQFFAEQGLPRVKLAHDEVEVSSNEACMGFVYFEIPGGIQYGTYSFDVKFENSIVSVPVEIMTEERAKQFTQEWKKSLKETKK